MLASTCLPSICIIQASLPLMMFVLAHHQEESSNGTLVDMTPEDCHLPCFMTFALKSSLINYKELASWRYDGTEPLMFPSRMHVHRSKQPHLLLKGNVEQAPSLDVYVIMKLHKFRLLHFFHPRSTLAFITTVYTLWHIPTAFFTAAFSLSSRQAGSSIAAS